MENHQSEIDQLKREIAEARKELEQAWEVCGSTNPKVLAFGEVFDNLINEYSRLVKQSIYK